MGLSLRRTMPVNFPAGTGFPLLELTALLIIAYWLADQAVRTEDSRIHKAARRRAASLESIGIGLRNPDLQSDDKGPGQFITLDLRRVGGESAYSIRLDH